MIHILSSAVTGDREKEEEMAKSFECQQGGILCDFEATGSSDEEVMAKAVAHAQQAHGVDFTQARTLERYAQSLVEPQPQAR